MTSWHHLNRVPSEQSKQCSPSPAAWSPPASVQEAPQRDPRGPGALWRKEAWRRRPGRGCSPAWGCVTWVLSLSEPPVPACLAQAAVETKLINTHLFSLILEIKLMPLINCAAQGRPPSPFSRDIQFKVKAGMGGVVYEKYFQRADGERGHVQRVMVAGRHLERWLRTQRSEVDCSWR